VAANVLAILLFPLAYLATGQPLDRDSNQVPLSTVALGQIPYSASILFAALIASWRKGRGPVTDFGIRIGWLDAPLGAVLGIVTQFAAAALYVPLVRWTSVTTHDLDKPARELTDRAHGAGVLLLVLIVVIVAPITEEIFFRGLLLRSLQRRGMGATWAIVASSALFAAAHFEPLQFPALFLFGLVAAILATRTGRLGPGIWAHIGFNAIAVAGLLR
jgi:uncharacterized protein